MTSTAGLGIKMVSKQVRQGFGITQKIEQLRENFRGCIQPCLDDAHLASVWYLKDEYSYLFKAVDLYYEYNDIMEEYKDDCRRDSHRQGKEDWAKTHLLFKPSCITRFCRKHGMGGRIIDINDRIKTFAKENKGRVSAVPKQSYRDFSDSRFGETIDSILGREAEMTELMRMLGCSDATDHTEVACELSSTVGKSESVPVIFLSGPAGYGKTALAQSLIQGQRVKEHFKDRIFWVSVSGQINDKKRFATTIIEAIQKTAPQYYEWDPLHGYLRSCIKKNETMLVILDGVCGVDAAIWDREFKPCLDAAGPQSRIVITTQVTDLAASMGIIREQTISLRELRGDDSWTLLHSTALPGQSEERIKEFETVGKKLVLGCHGVPYVIKHLGYFLRSKGNPQQWKDVNLWNLYSNKEGMLPPLLAATYDAFPYALRLCLKCCACLPYDYEIDKNILIKWWMGLGLLDKTDADRREMEEKGEDYFNILKTSSFLQGFPGASADENGWLTHYRYYPHVDALARSLAGNDSCFYTDRGSCSSSYINGRCIKYSTLILCDDDIDFIPDSLCQAERLMLLKVIIKNPRGQPFKALSYLFSRFRYLRVFEMTCTGITEIPSEIDKLKLLKVLNLSGLKIKRLPDSLCNLKSLQSLILNDCLNLTSLPQNTEQLTTLRHLEVKNTGDLRFLPKGIGKLTNLRTLSMFPVAAQGVRKGAKLEELKHLNLLEGHLHIKGLTRVKSSVEAVKAEMVNKKRLRSLCLDFETNHYELCKTTNPKALQIMKDVLEALRPDEGIDKVEVLHYPRPSPSWVTTTN